MPGQDIQELVQALGTILSQMHDTWHAQGPQREPAPGLPQGLVMILEHLRTQRPPPGRGRRLALPEAPRRDEDEDEDDDE